MVGEIWCCVRLLESIVAGEGGDGEEVEEMLPGFFLRPIVVGRSFFFPLSEFGERRLRRLYFGGILGFWWFFGR